MENLKVHIEAALGKKEADVLIRNINLINVFNGKIEKSNIYILGENIVRVVLEENDMLNKAKDVYDGSDQYIFPGLIDAHTHIEMSFMSATSFAEAVIKHGTTGAILDLHDIGNVGLEESIEFAKEIKRTPLKTKLMLPPCIPSTPGKEEAGCVMDIALMKKWISSIDIGGIGETMDFNRVVQGEGEMLKILELAQQENLLIEGHCPQLSGDSLQAYAVAGVTSDHESVSLEEMLEKYRLGYRIILRRGSLKEPVNAKTFLDAVHDTSNVMLSTDGCIQLDTILERGTMIQAIRELVKEGVNPITAIQLGTINVAKAHGMENKLGIIAPGRIADMVIVNNLKEFKIQSIYISGKKVTDNYRLDQMKFSEKITHSIKMLPVKKEYFQMNSENQSEKINIISVREDTLITKKLIDDIRVVNGFIESDSNKDYLKIAVFNRYTTNLDYKIGFVNGFGLKNGAIAGTVAQDSQNMIVIGTNDSDMTAAVNYLIEKQGGIVFVAGNKEKAFVPLPVGGIMNGELKPIEMQKLFHKVSEETIKNGGKFGNPSFVMAFMLTCPAIPEIKITNKALIDVTTGKEISLFV